MNKWEGLRHWLNKESIHFNNKHPLTDVIYKMDLIDREYCRELEKTGETDEKLSGVIDKVFHRLFNNIREALLKMPDSQGVDYINRELSEIWGLVYVDIPKVTLKRIEEVRKEERAKADAPCHNCPTCQHYKIEDQFGKCLITDSSVYALSVNNCALWKAKEQRVCGTCTYYKDSACHADFRHFCTMSPIESCSHWQSTCTTYTNKTTDNTKMFMSQINKLQTAVMEIRNKLGMNK